MENDSVRYSRAGDVFHYRWAARRCIRMLHPKSSVKCIVIEGSKENEVTGENVIDVAEYTEDAEGYDKKITYFQLKHTTQRVDQPFTLSGLKDTIEGFAKRFLALLSTDDNKYEFGTVRFSVITNREIADSFKEEISLIKNGSKAGKQFQETLEKYTELQDVRLQEFCNSLDLIDGEGDYIAQRGELHTEISAFLAGAVDNAQIDSLIALIQDKALPDNKGEIIREDILKCFKVTSERDLFPAPMEFEKSRNFIKREQHKILLSSVLETSTPVIIHAGGGVGKSVFSRQLAESLPTGSLGIVYDCFGSGKYRNRSESRHRHRDALVQIANEIALHDLLCEILIPLSTDLDDAILRAFLSRLKTASTAIRKVDKDAVLAILIDAADNAEMAAKEFSESCFAHQLLREEVPEGCRIIILCRTERIDLLKPLSTVRQIELKPFSQSETVIHLREHFPSATDIDGLEFHRLTGGNPRVQANALSIHHNTVSDVLAGLGPSGATVEEQIAAQLESAISTIKDKLPTDFQIHINAICLGLANLTPFIPINVLATAAQVEVSTVVSFVADLGRPLWISENSVQFRDEPTETWFRERFSASKQQIESYIMSLKPLASEFSYVAQVLPSLLLQSENYDELISLALSDDYLPQDSPIDERNIRVYRLQFAFKAALKQKKYADAAKLALRAGEEVAGDKRQLELLIQNVDLIAPLQSPQRVQELALRRMLRGSWDGSANVYSAALLSYVEEFKGEARGFLRSASNWLKLYLEERSKNEDKIHSEKQLKEDDIVEMAVAHFHLYGASKLVDFIWGWQPPEVVFQITCLFIKRLIDAGNFTAVDEISQLGCRNQYLMVAIADELMAVGKFPSTDAMRQCLSLLAHKRVRIPKPTEYRREQRFTSAIISFAEASSAIGLSQTQILRVLNHYLPQRGFGLVSYKHYDGERHIFLRVTAFRCAISGDFAPNINALIPQKLLEDEKKYRQDIEDCKQIIEGMLPWYLIRARILLASVENLEIAFQHADRLSKKLLLWRYEQHDHLLSEIARVRFESLALKKPCDRSEKGHRIVQLFDNEYKLSLQDHLSAVRAAYRLEHLSEIRSQLEQSCYEMVVSVSNEGLETKAENYIALARAVLPVSPADAAAYFNCAIEAVSMFGDELVDRWKAVVAMAKRSAEGGGSSPEIAYRFIRCAELVGDSVAREKHWSRNEAIQVCAKLCPSSAFATLSRWRDRDVGWFEGQLLAVAREAVRSKIIEPLVGWSLSAFSWDYDGYDEFVALCIETESDKTRRQYILDTAVRDLRLNEASESIWHNLKRVSDRFSLKNKDLQQVLDFYAEHPQRSDREKASQISQIDERKESISIDWKEVFGDLKLTKSMEISAAIDRFNALPHPRSHEVFWQEVFKRIPESQASELLLALPNVEKADLYDMEYALSNFPDTYRQKISVKKSWNNVLSLIAQRFAYKFTNYYLKQYFFEKIKPDDSALSSIYKGVLQGLSESCNIVDASTLFGFSEIVSSFISPQDAGALLEFALSRFEIQIDREYADGHWDKWLLPPDNISGAFTGFIWAALGSPRSAVRWQAAHCVRRLAEAGCDREIDGLIEWMKRDCVNAFGSHVFPFYNLHARLYLLIALARIAIDSPEKLRRYHSIFADLALDGLPHILIQKFAAEIALSLEAAFPETYDSGVTEKLRQVGISQIPVKEIDGYRENFEETPWHTRGEVDRNLKLHFSWDLEHYWFEPLGRVFGIPENQVEELAREVVLKEWDIEIKDESIHDPRENLWHSHRYERETWHSHGSYPRTDDYSFYISYHAMLSVAAKLLLEMPVIDEYNWCDDQWTDWFQRHTLTRSDRLWLADRRDPPPLKRRAWLQDKITENWRQEIRSDDFLDGLLIEHNGKTWLNVRGSWSDRNGEPQESFHVTSALVSSETSESLLNALSTCVDPYDFKLPAYQEEEMEFNEFPFELQGWIWRGSQDNRLDATDPYAGEIDYPPYRIGNSIIERLRLSVDLERRKWFMPGTAKESLVCELWSSSEREHSEESRRHGIRMSASLEFLKILCSTLDRDLIVEVQIQRRFCRSSYYTRSNDDGEYSTPNSKIYILSADGKLRDTGTCYQLR
ncbi:hypothetical protein QUA20_02570 [Microcoleus sp. Pol7_A1]|uniref:hypothetical protein n=1 Tax=Microcoleus sp. Pol7_A1 TaxID=2818893 RepID=UPI002FD1B617